MNDGYHIIQTGTYEYICITGEMGMIIPIIYQNIRNIRCTKDNYWILLRSFSIHMRKGQDLNVNSLFHYCKFPKCNTNERIYITYIVFVNCFVNPTLICNERGRSIAFSETNCSAEQHILLLFRVTMSAIIRVTRSILWGRYIPFYLLYWRISTLA